MPRPGELSMGSEEELQTMLQGKAKETDILLRKKLQSHPDLKKEMPSGRTQVLISCEGPTSPEHWQHGGTKGSRRALGSILSLRAQNHTLP